MKKENLAKDLQNLEKTSIKFIKMIEQKESKVNKKSIEFQNFRKKKKKYFRETTILFTHNLFYKKYVPSLSLRASYYTSIQLNAK